MLSTKSTDKPCARCESPLFEATEKDFSLLGCGRCGGAWMSNEDAAELLAGQATMAKVLSDRLAEKTVVNPALLARDAKCPHCRGDLRMVRINGVELDVCVEHGTWFDRNEIQSVTKLLRAPTPVVPGAPIAASFPAAYRYKFLFWYGKLCWAFAGLTGLLGFILLLDGCHVFDKKDGFHGSPKVAMLGQVHLLFWVVVITLTWLAMAQACKLLLDLADKP